MDQEKRAVVTGATSGIGEAIARLLAAKGITVVLVGRSEGRLDQARRRILAHVPDADLHTERADLSLLAQVRKLAERLAQAPPPDIVVSNAAVIAPIGDITSEGLQRTLATNHLAPYLLLRSLISSIGTRQARFVVVGADPQRLARLPVNLDDLGFQTGRGLGPVPSIRPLIAYAHTKNMNAMFVYALAHRLEGTQICVNGAHPGVIKTELGRNTRGLARILAAAQRQFKPGPDTGADTTAWLATAPEVDSVSGRFFVKRKQVPTAPHTTDVTRCDRLWDESARMVGLSPAV